MLEDLRDIRVDAQTGGGERLGEFSVANQVRIAGDGAGEISRALAVDWICVPDPPNVDSVADRAHKFVIGDSAARAHHDVSAGRTGTRVEAPSSTFAQPVTAQWWKLELRGSARAQLLSAMLVGKHPMGIVEIRE